MLKVSYSVVVLRLYMHILKLSGLLSYTPTVGESVSQAGGSTTKKERNKQTNRTHSRGIQTTLRTKEMSFQISVE